MSNAVELGYIGARKVDLATAMREADFVVACPLLNDETRHLIGAAQFALMKPTAYFINVSRGPVVDETALIAALQAGRIAGAALDVFEQEPVDPANPLLKMDNVIVTPHSLCWTDECFHNMATTGLTSIVDALGGRVPEFVVNREVLAHARVRGVARAARRDGATSPREVLPGAMLALLVALPAAAFDLQGHRGARGLAPENTLAGFKRTLAIGVTTLETDVVVTRDGVPVIAHDPTSIRIWRAAGRRSFRTRQTLIRSLTLAELKERYDIGRLNAPAAMRGSGPNSIPPTANAIRRSPNCCN